MPGGFEFIAQRGGAAALPDDGMMDRLTGSPIPDDRRLALVGDTDSGDIARLESRLLDRLPCDGDLAVPDFVGVVLHPAGLWEVLSELALVSSHLPPVLIEHNCP